MMHYGYYSVFDEVRRMLQWQGAKLLELEREIAAIKERLQQGTEPLGRTHVEKIEYHFEQLKVENLNGALHIGISPGEAATVEDLFQEGQYTADVKMGEKETGSGEQGRDIEQRIRDEVIRYIRDVIPPELESKALTEDEIRAVVEDMIRQTGERIPLYLQQFTQQGEKDEAKLKETVSQRIKGDVYEALERYVEHFKKEDHT